MEHWFSHKYWIGSFVVFTTQLFDEVKVIHKLQLQLTTTFVDTRFLLPLNRDHWKIDQFWGSANHGEIYLDSDVNLLASGNNRKYTTVTTQCEQLTWIWTWILLYFYCWFHFKKRPGIHRVHPKTSPFLHAISFEWNTRL